MHISSSMTFGIIKAVISSLEKFFFRRAYEISTMYRCHREILGRFPKPLCNDLQYDIHLGKYYLRELKICPMFWIKAINNKTFSKVVLTVTAKKNSKKFQDSLTLFDVNSVPTQTSLSRIPFKKVLVEGSQVYLTYDEVVIKIVELYDADGRPINIFGDGTVYFHPVDNLAVAMGLEKGDFEKWGEVFNDQFIEMEIREEYIRHFEYKHNTLNPIKYVKGILFRSDWFIRANFWRKNLRSAKQLTAEYEEYIRQQQELDTWRIERDLEEQNKRVEVKKLFENV